LPTDLPRVPEYIDPDPRLIEKMRCIGEDITEILEYIPAGFYVRQIIRRKYAPSGGQGSVVMAPLPALPIEKGRPGPGVLAYVITSKYCDHCVPRTCTRKEVLSTQGTVKEMRGGPSKPVYRNRLQTTLSCSGQEPGW
jgi:transposase